MENNQVVPEPLKVTEIDGKKPCALCDKALPAFGVLLGLVFVAISVDLLTGGFLSKMVASRSRSAVIEGEVVDDGEE